MHAMTARKRWLAVGAITTIWVLAPGTARADLGVGESNGAKTESKRQGQTLESRINYSGTAKGSGSNSSRGFTPVGNWTPPACWYEPRTAEDFAKATEDGYTQMMADSNQPSYAKRSVGETRDYYKEGEYKNYNIDKADEGNFWVPVRDEQRLQEPAASACTRMPFWVENGDAPDVENPVTPEVLAQLAYSQVEVPGTDVALKPENTTKVNLPTWAWLDKVKFKPVSVTAALNAGGLNIQATTTATPVSLKIEPGTKDAKLHPTSGECPINEDDSIGTPYTKGSGDNAPPCGLTYLRSSGDGTYKLQATITWKITWEGTGGTGGDLPDGTFGNAQDITVQEIQSINR
jgi:hypothetical protein